jgi:hypothetical protein
MASLARVHFKQRDAYAIGEADSDKMDICSSWNLAGQPEFLAVYWTLTFGNNKMTSAGSPLTNSISETAHTEQVNNNAEATLIRLVDGR